MQPTLRQRSISRCEPLRRKYIKKWFPRDPVPRFVRRFLRLGMFGLVIFCLLSRGKKSQLRLVGFLLGSSLAPLEVGQPLSCIACSTPPIGDPSLPKAMGSACGPGGGFRHDGARKVGPCAVSASPDSTCRQPTAGNTSAASPMAVAFFSGARYLENGRKS